ncbi:MAG TPA: transporter substrate-binding domain-containing protein [Micromonosporaceae bacterium]|nr:transporter substrate-binding domain-containing protein [Micromonosporaceae bacterium]
MSDTSSDGYPSPRPGRRALTAICLTAMLVLVGTAACKPEPQKETVASLRAKSRTLQGKDRLRIGVRETVPYLGYLDAKTKVRSGFEVELAKALAGELGFAENQIDWVTVTTVPDRISALQSNRADMVLANLSMTDDREKRLDFAGPYLLVPQAVMVLRGRPKPLREIADLSAPGVKVCTGTGSTSEAVLRSHRIFPASVDTSIQCIEGLKSKKYDAYSTDLPILAGFLRGAEDTFEILDLTIAPYEEKIGVAVPDGDEAFRNLVKYFLNRWQEGPKDSSNPWLRAYDRTLGLTPLDSRYRSQPRVDAPPDLLDETSKAPR